MAEATEATAKQLALRAVEALPDDATFEDAMERLYFLEKIARGRADARAGRTVPHEEVVARPRIRWSAEALGDLVGIHDHIAPTSRAICPGTPRPRRGGSSRPWTGCASSPSPAESCPSSPIRRSGR